MLLLQGQWVFVRGRGGLWYMCWVFLRENAGVLWAVVVWVVVQERCELTWVIVVLRVGCSHSKCHGTP